MKIKKLSLMFAIIILIVSLPFAESFIATDDNYNVEATFGFGAETITSEDILVSYSLIEQPASRDKSVKEYVSLSPHATPFTSWSYPLAKDISYFYGPVGLMAAKDKNGKIYYFYNGLNNYPRKAVDQDLNVEWQEDVDPVTGVPWDIQTNEEGRLFFAWQCNKEKACNAYNEILAEAEAEYPADIIVVVHAHKIYMDELEFFAPNIGRTLTPSASTGNPYATSNNPFSLAEMKNALSVFTSNPLRARTSSEAFGRRTPVLKQLMCLSDKLAKIAEMPGMEFVGPCGFSGGGVVRGVNDFEFLVFLKRSKSPESIAEVFEGAESVISLGEGSPLWGLGILNDYPSIKRYTAIEEKREYVSMLRGPVLKVRTQEYPIKQWTESGRYKYLITNYNKPLPGVEPADLVIVNAPYPDTIERPTSLIQAIDRNLRRGGKAGIATEAGITNLDWYLAKTSPELFRYGIIRSGLPPGYGGVYIERSILVGWEDYANFITLYKP